RRGRVLHAAENEIGDDDLRVLVPRVLHAEELPEMADHLRRLLERALAVFFAALRHPIRDGYAAIFGGSFVFQDRELAGDERDEVARVRLLHRPREGVSLFLELAVSEDGPTLRRRHGE